MLLLNLLELQFNAIDKIHFLIRNGSRVTGTGTQERLGVELGTSLGAH